MVTCYLGIGSNLGNRKKNIRSAVSRLNALPATRVMKASRIIETRPVGGPAGQRKYLNGVLKIDTHFSALRLLKELQGIERALGRPKRHVPKGPRVIDLDILLYDDAFLRRRGLVVPHPRLFEREFVLRPLLEVI